MKKILLLALLFNTVHLRSQNVFVVGMGTDSTWEAYNSVIETREGNYISLGYSFTPNKYDVVYVTSNDKNGVFQWAKTLNNGYQGVGGRLFNTSDGNFVTCSLIGNNYASVIKFNDAGTILWAKRYSIYEVHALVQTDDGGFIMCGCLTPGALGKKRDAYILKTDSLGNVKWSKEFFSTTYYSDVLDIKKTHDNNFIFLSENSNATLKGDTAYVVKIDTSGNILWSKYMLGVNGGAGLGGSNILATSEGGYLITGTSYDINAAIATKLNGNGNIEWSKYINPQGTFGIYGHNAIETSDGYITCEDGTNQTNALFIFTKFDKAGNVVWSKTINKRYYTDNIAPYYLIQTKNGEFVGVENDGIYYTDAIITKFDVNFNTCASEGTYGSWQDFGSSDTAEVISLNQNVSSATDSFATSSVDSYTFLCTALPLKLLSFTAQKQNNSTLLQWQTANEINTSYFNIQRSTDGKSFANIGKVQSKGSSKVQNDYSYNDDISQLHADKLYYRLQEVDKDGKITYSNVQVIDFVKNKSLFSISPNPAKDYIHITSSASVSNAQITIISATGKTLYSTKHNFNSGEQIKVTVSAFANQTLFVTINASSSKQQFKVVKE